MSRRGTRRNGSAAWKMPGRTIPLRTDMDISRLYIDSSTLIANGWPEPRAELQTILRMAQVVDATVFLPETVEAECEAEWVRRLDKARRTRQVRWTRSRHTPRC
jgi:hypothetical protein